MGPDPATRDGYESLKVRAYSLISILRTEDLISFYQISRREYLKKEVELSTSVRGYSDLFFRFMSKAHSITMLMLERLSDEMGLKGSARFETFHQDTRPTLSTLAFLRYPKHDELAADSVGHNQHTDIGSLTFLLAGQWGLQILTPGSNTWAFVQPRPNHAVINVGDSLHFPSEGQLASVIHRVIPLEGKQQEDRYSIAYLMRVNDDLRWKDSTGKTWSAKAWHDFKFDAFRTSDVMEDGVQIVTGMRAQNGVLKDPVEKAPATTYLKLN